MPWTSAEERDLYSSEGKYKFLNKTFGVLEDVPKARVWQVHAQMHV